MAHHNYLIGHNTNPDRNKTNPSRLTALTPQNQPERPLLRGNQGLGFDSEANIGSCHDLRHDLEPPSYVIEVELASRSDFSAYCSATRDSSA